MQNQNSPLLGTETDPGYIPTSEEKTMAILSHVLCLVAWLFPALIIYLVKKDESAYITAHAKESLNFQITVTIIAVILAITIIGLFLLWLVGIVAMVFVIIATIKASEANCTVILSHQADQVIPRLRLAQVIRLCSGELIWLTPKPRL